MKTLLLALFLGYSAFAYAEGILPGEPDPNTSPKTDNMKMEEREKTTLVDDRNPCPKGKRRYQHMECGRPGLKPECEHYHLKTDCHKRMPKLRCKKPFVPVLVYECQPDHE